MTYIPDAYDQWKKHDAEMEEELWKLPVCAYCCEPIQTEYCFKTDDGLVCEDCMEDRKECVADYIM